MNTLTVVNVEVRQDAAGRYSLNDLHRASGGEDHTRPGSWLRLDATTKLAEEWLSCTDLCSFPVQPVESINGKGTYAVRELVYAYAMWISPAFHLRVIRAYDALVTAAMPTTRTPVAEVDEDWQRASKIRAAKTTFVSILQVARTMGMHHARCLDSANRASIRHHGVDMIAECDAQDRLLPDAHPATAPANSVGAFMAALDGGELGGIESGPVLSRDLYELYTGWCRRRGDLAYPMPRMFHALQSGFRIPIVRCRYLLADGFHGPHGVVMLGGDRAPPAGLNQGEWIGQCITRFRQQAAASMASPLARAA